MDFLLEVAALTKRFGQFTAVDNISFGIRPGSCFGLLGPNGAGKTTTIEMIESIVEPTSGSIRYRGKPRDHQFQESIGIQFQTTALQDFLTVAEVLRLFHSFYRKALPIEQLVQRCQLEEFIDRQANKLSGGQKQRLLLALALINDPDIVFLDEPTTGLDPQSRRRFWDLIESIRDDGKTIVLTTHYMDEAELLCDELVIMDHGKIIAQGSPAALLAEHLPNKRVSLQASDTLDLSALSSPWQQHQQQLDITTDSVERTLQQLIDAGADLSTLKVHNPSLEDLFLKLTGHQLRE